MPALISPRGALASSRRFIADGLSLGNLACGTLSMYFAAHGLLPLSLAALLVGALLDGLDGAAARRWGGTRFGVYSDDIADGVNYGIAPGFALWVTLGGVEGAACGIAFAAFTLSRLVFFTLNKEGSDPATFAGVPSTVGGVVALCALILFPHAPALVGLAVGGACALMVSFDTLHRHLGRLVARDLRLAMPLPVVATALLCCSFAFGAAVPAALIMAAALTYGFAPTALHFRRVSRAALRRRSQRRQPKTKASGLLEAASLMVEGGAQAGMEEARMGDDGGSRDQTRQHGEAHTGPAPQARATSGGWISLGGMG